MRQCAFLKHELRIADCGLGIPDTTRIRNPKSASRNHWHSCLCLVLSVAGAASARYSYPPSARVAGQGTAPPSSYGSGLVTMPSPVDNASNSVVTGNVSGGKAFRGNVPYSSPTSFGGRLGSTSLDSFLRYSAVPEELRNGAADYTPFYSPTGTVSKIPPGSSGVFAPSSPKVAGVPLQFRAEQPTDTIPSAETTQPQFSPDQTGSSRFGGGFLPPAGRSPVPLDSGRLWSTRTPEEMRRLVAGESGNPSPEQQPTPQSRQVMTSEEYQRQLEHLQQDFNRVKTTASQFEQDLQTGRQMPTQTMGQNPVTPPAQPMLSTTALRNIFQTQNQTPAADLTPGQGQRANSAPLASNDATYGQPASTGPSAAELPAQKSRIDTIFAPRTEGTAIENVGLESTPTHPRGPDPALSQEPTPAPRLDPSLFGPPAPARTEGSAPQAGIPAAQRVEEIARTFDAPGQLIQHPLQNSTGGAPSAAEPVPAPMDQAQAAPSTPAFAAATSSPSKPRSLEGVAPAKPPVLNAASKKKFDNSMALAQLDMRQGRYSRAAESFALASVYNPTDAKSQIGRSHALLAVGEYLGSAASLAKAIELDPRSALAKADLIEILGGVDRCIQRITDLQQQAETNSAPGLQLLLAYICYEMNELQGAKTAIRAAKRALPSSPSVDLLQAAIEQVASG
jgi:hypothetical protein